MPPTSSSTSRRSHRVGELAAALGRQVGDGHAGSTITLLRTGTVLDPDGTVGDSGIVSGDDLVVGPPYPVQRVPAIPVRAVTLDVLAGRDTGTSLILLQGNVLDRPRPGGAGHPHRSRPSRATTSTSPSPPTGA